MSTTINLNQLFEQAVEQRAEERAAEILAAKLTTKPEVPSDFTPDGQVITPYIFDGKKYLTCQQVQILLGVKYPALWAMKKRGALPYHKSGNRILYDYDAVKKHLEGIN